MHSTNLRRLFFIHARRSVVVNAMILMSMACCDSSLRAQDSTQIDALRLTGTSLVVGASMVSVHLYQQKAWWQGERAPFRFENDWAYALNVDKFGHAFAAYGLSYGFSGVLSWVGLDHTSSVFWGMVMAITYQMYVEVEDGYHRSYGFSPGDAISNITGAAYAAARQKVPFLENFAYKYSYWPSKEFLENRKADKSRVFLDDYQGTTYWMGIDPHFFLGEDLRSIVPSWLGIGVGIAARNLDGNGGGDKKYYVALDHNFRRIHTESDFLRTLFFMMDFIHLPSPGVIWENGRVRLGVFY